MSIEKKTIKERKAEHLAAWELAKQGDEAAYRALTEERCIAECASDGVAPHGMFARSRKFSNPLFMTPTGYLAAFPELDEHLFLSSETAFQAIAKYSKPEHYASWRVSSTKLSKELRDKQYQRWLREVKNSNAPYIEPRRSLEECASIYASGGIEALKKIYSKAHALKTEHRIVEAGLAEREIRQVPDFSYNSRNDR
ncbi:hypothetical protein [Polaromonas glacialis]|uniref:hypothetical protein n=1 Tax=Polaromonas glacialis TaxID=866564 RepID=UPI000496FDFC|nr:hypothetical protein [Polaromonas glacialis]